MEIDEKNVALILPTLNPGTHFSKWMRSFNKQSFKPVYRLVIDSSSTDGSIETISTNGFQIKTILPQDFNHGGTRQMGAEMFPQVRIIIFLTQDAILADEFAIENILKCFDNDQVGAAYGRQLPQLGAGVISAHARLFNYPNKSVLKSLEDASKWGIKTAFLSNSFAAYRVECLNMVGGFPSHTILGEDTYIAAKMLLAGWKIQYSAEAQVYHSHDYNYVEEFKRYFDIGVFHSQEPWLREKFGQAEGEGLKFVLSETKYVLTQGKGYLLPSVLIRTCLKYLGYRLGTFEARIPKKLKKRLSMHWHYWNL